MNTYLKVSVPTHLDKHPSARYALPQKSKEKEHSTTILQNLHMTEFRNHNRHTFCLISTE